MNWKQSDRVCAGAALAAVLGCAQIAAANQEEVFTGFEGISADEFTIGEPPNTATFGGDGFSATIGDLSLYYNGLFAWMVMGGGVGTIDFETNAESVSFWARTNPTAGPDETTLIEVFDDDGIVIDSITIENTGWEFVEFEGSIDSIEVTNNDDQMNSVDDFGFFPEKPECPGDLNGCGTVDSMDLNIVLGDFGCTGGGCDGDASGDGDTDSEDLNIILGVFGESCPTG